MPKTLDLKSTLNLPRTDFPMKAKLPEREPVQLAEWEGMGIYRRILDSREGAPLFILHDGPPYPTGDIHLGTGLNKTLKDLVVKSRTMAGFRSPYIPGWDCHGLPIETQVEKELGGKKHRVAPAEFRRMCREFAARYVDQNRRDFKRLGIFGRWEDPYLTMSNEYEACIAGAFVTFLEKGYVYRGLKPVYWCLVDRTALAEAEVEYEDHTSHSVWVKFPIVAGKQSHRFGHDVSAVIWTTTPWTLPANQALAFHPSYEYVVAETSAGILLIAADRLKPVAQECKFEIDKVGGPWKGAEFEGIPFRHPFLDRQVPGVLADYVTLEQGSGIVHTAPGHGAEDYQTGQKYGLPTYAPLDDDGRFTEGLPEYKGKTVWQANAPIVELLRARGVLLGEHKYKHTYPHCWRCHNPVIFRATEQWFIKMDYPERGSLRESALAEIPKVKWIPGWGQERIHDMIAQRPDWCISRQRFWGVPLIIFYCDQCETRLEDFGALRHVVKWFEREGADAWFTHPAEELLPSGTKCPKCGVTKWRKENDILDVWFDSGSSNLAVLAKRPGKPRSDVYLEGPDQYRGWFHSSLLVAVGVDGQRPYNEVVTHGWTLDAQGVPMSKSRGNFVSPGEVCEKWGADLLRLWVASQDYFTDARWSDTAMAQVAEAYRKLRNTFRFALSNLYDFEPARDAVPEPELWEMDAWMLRRTGELVKQCRAWYDEYEFHRVFHALHDFAVVDLSAFYFDILKDRLYTFAPRTKGRRSAQTAIHQITSSVVRLIAPILVFTAEEVWKHFPRWKGHPDSVHMAHFPDAADLGASFDSEKVKNWERLLSVREEVLKSLEQARAAKMISGSLEAKVSLHADGDLAPLLERYASWLPALFIVSQVMVTRDAQAETTRSDGNSGLRVEVSRADGVKCERCWNYSTRVGEDRDYPTLCERCVVALEEIERDHAPRQGAGS
ncbi:MAG: isoleucine--tRNA ligase [Candidatus Acidiferrales bacterium]